MRLFADEKSSRHRKPHLIASRKATDGEDPLEPLDE